MLHFFSQKMALEVRIMISHSFSFKIYWAQTFIAKSYFFQMFTLSCEEAGACCGVIRLGSGN